jgi:hypothetical protein
MSSPISGDAGANKQPLPSVLEVALSANFVFAKIQQSERDSARRRAVG